MTVVGMSKITSKGQVTLPLYVRRLLELDKGQSIAFCLNKSGILISRCKVSVERAGFSKAQWQKIEKLAGTKGKNFSGPEEAKRYVKRL